VSEAPEHGRWEDELAAFALGALERPEADAMERHLGECERCQKRLRWLEPAVDVLPASVEQLEPPPELRERLTGIVRREAEAAARPAPRRKAWLAPSRPAIAFGALAALVAAGIGGYAVRDEEDTSTVPVGASAKAPGATAEIEREGDSGTLLVNGLPELRGRDVYEVWLKERHRISPSSLFVLDRGAGATVAIPSGLDQAAQVMVTREPSGGSRHPSGPPMLRATLD
jgi:anti-sigma-K factor RskA